MLVELEAEQLGSSVDLVPMDAGGERRLLQLLAHRLRLQPLEAGWPDEAAGENEPGELVAREQRPHQRGVAGNCEMLGVGQNRLDDHLGVALLAQDRGTVLRVLVECGVDLVVEVVEEGRAAPQLLVLAERARIPARRRFHRKRMTQK